MTASARVALGVTLYNRAEFLPEALDSFLAQTYRDFALVLVDDGSTDDTPLVARRYAALDPRIVYRRNATRLGLVGNWRRAFELARRLYPGHEFYAWGSDHDRWDARWLGTLVGELERRPEAVLA